jgi:hypothetical protein
MQRNHKLLVQTIMNKKLRAALITVAVVQLLLGVVVVLGSIRDSIAGTYAQWDRIEPLITSGALDLPKFDAYLVAHGRRPTGLTMEQVLAAPGSRPGGFDAISNCLNGPVGWGAPYLPAGAVALLVCGIAVLALSLSLRSGPPAPTIAA